MKALVLTLMLACVVPGLSARPAAQHPHQHEPGVDGANVMIPVPQQRWATDAPLREGMRRVHKALAELQDYPGGHISEAAALQRVTAIKDAGAFMFANCKLPAQPDEALHSILVPLLTAAQKLENDPSDMGQVQAMQQAVAKYPAYFDDPDWQAPSNDGDITR